MITTELRRNNLIMYGNMIYPVERITETSISVRLSSQSLRTARPHEFEPVALSAEILEAAGFEKRGEGTYKNDIFMWFNNQMYLKIGFDDEYEIGIQYLHELQNYFPITGTELTINLEKVKV